MANLTLGWAKASWDKKTVNEHPAVSMRCKYHEHDDEVLMGDTCVAGAAKSSSKKKAVLKLTPVKVQRYRVASG